MAIRVNYTGSLYDVVADNNRLPWNTLEFVCDTLAELPSAATAIENDAAFVVANSFHYIWLSGAWAFDYSTASGGGIGTNLTTTVAASTLTVNSDTGTDAVLPAATSANAGVMTGADKTKIDAITGTNTGDQTSIAGITGTKAQFDTAVTDGNFAYASDLSGYQPVDATLTALAAADWAANALPIGSGANTLAQVSFAANTFPARSSAGNLVAKAITDFGLSLVDDADATAARTTLGLGSLATQSGTFSGTSSGTNTGDQSLAAYATTAAVAAGYQPLDTQLTDVAGLAYAGNALKVVRVNAGATAFELATVSGGGGGYSLTTEIAGFTESATSGEVVRLCDLAAGFTVVLPTAVGNTSKLTYKKMQSAGSIIIDANAAETIDGGLTATLNLQYESITLVSNNANWMII